MQKKFFVLFYLVSLSCWLPAAKATVAKDPISIIPRPASVTRLKGEFILSARTAILAPAAPSEIKRLAHYLQEQIRQLSGWTIPLIATSKSNRNLICFNISSEQALGDEGYRLNIGRHKIEIEANQPPGLFYGCQSLLQLVPLPTPDAKKMPATPLAFPDLRISDQPRYPYRGMHLDVCRHFFDVAFVKKYIDILALHKMNVFHWHLTEDQGWRIEIKKYPRLTEIGAWRINADGSRHGGYYTQDDIRAVVAYAAERFVTVIPEIEMPGHSLAALASYPELSCRGGPFSLSDRWGIFADVYCAGNEKTFTFIQDVLAEVIVLFPSTYIHIGGDECPKTRWENCPKCLACMQSEGLQNADELQSYFIKRIEKFLNSRNKKLIGWDEILAGGLAPQATVMSWRGTAGGISAARAHHDVIMAPTSHLYFDYYQGEDRSAEPPAIGGDLPLQKVYAFEPTPEALTENEALHILGAQGQLWSEYIATPEYAEYMLLPRLCALAEVNWTPKPGRDWNDFLRRLDEHVLRLRLLKINCRIPPPEGLSRFALLSAAKQVSLSSPLPSGRIRFTTDGSDPTYASKPLTGPITVSGDTVIKARVFLSKDLFSPISSASFFHIQPASGYVNGLQYAYYFGTFAADSDFSRLTPQKTGWAFEPSLSEINISDQEANCTVIFSGFLKIEAAAEYTFTVQTDDRFKLLIADREIVSRSADTAVTGEITVKIKLEAGLHPLRIIFIRTSPETGYEIFIESTNLPRQNLPARLLFRNG